jgi:hypothetical protein
MARYYREEDIQAIIKRLIKEPAYQHEDEDFYVGVCAVEGELYSIPIENTVEIVKCSECRYRHTEGDFVNCCKMSHGLTGPATENTFCSHGKAK